jgi:hypothetical protein
VRWDFASDCGTKLLGTEIVIDSGMRWAQLLMVVLAWPSLIGCSSGQKRLGCNDNATKSGDEEWPEDWKFKTFTKLNFFTSECKRYSSEIACTALKNVSVHFYIDRFVKSFMRLLATFAEIWVLFTAGSHLTKAAFDHGSHPWPHMRCWITYGVSPEILRVGFFDSWGMA